MLAYPALENEASSKLLPMNKAELQTSLIEALLASQDDGETKSSSSTFIIGRATISTSKK